MKFFHDNKFTLKPDPEQTFIGIWFHDDNLTDDQINQMELYLNHTFYYYRVFTNMQQFCSYIDEKRLVAKPFIIMSISNLSSDAIVDLIQAKLKNGKIYIFLSTMTSTRSCVNTNDIDYLFTKIFKDIDNLLKKTNIPSEAKPINISRINEISKPSSKFFSKSDQITSIRHLTEEPVGYLRFLTILKILLHISCNADEITDMRQACRRLYENDGARLQKIETLLNEYTSDKAINHYTESTSLCLAVNEACRTENAQRIYEFRVYINNLNYQLEQLCIQQEEDELKSTIKTVYRGKLLSTSVLQQLIDKEEKLISMNGFLSTTLSSDVANVYSGVEQNIDDGYKSVRFVLTIDEIKQPYASLQGLSAIRDEEEILFSLGTIWRIDSVEFKEKLYEIKLVSYSKLDSELDTLLEKYTKNGYNLSSVGDVLRELGNYDEAIWFYEKMLEHPHLSEETCCYLYYNMGIMQKELGRNSEARRCFNKAARLLKSSTMKSNEIIPTREIYICDTEVIPIAVYNNMGLLHDKKSNFNEAVISYEQALEVKDGPPSEMAIVYNNLGCLYSRYGNYKQARNYHAVAVELVDENQLYWGEFKRNLAHVEKIYNI